MNTLISYKNDKGLKDMLVKEIERHRKLDKIVQGRYGKNEDGDNFRGCAVGCSIHSLNVKLNKDFSPNDHSVYEKELGIPEWLARLEDTIFEGLPKNEAVKWPSAFAKSVPVGVNLEPIKWKFCAFILKENIERVLTLTISDDLKKQVVDAIRGCLSLHENAIRTGIWDESAARSAVESARSAAWSAAWSARSAAWSAAWSARSAAYKKYAKELLRFIKNCK